MSSPIRHCALLVVVLVAAGWLPLAALPARAQSPLQQERQRQQGPMAGSKILTGQVVSVLSGLIYTNITPDLRVAGISDSSALRIRLAGRILDARFLTPAHYLQVVTDPVARKGLDVDVACTLDQNGGLVVVGLGGGLAEWLRVEAGASVTIERR